MTGWAAPGSSAGATELDEGSGAMLAPVLARVTLAAVFCGFGAVAMAYVLDSTSEPAMIGLAAGCLVALLGLQFFVIGSTRPPSPAVAHAALAAQTVLAYLPLPLFGQAWVSQPSFLAGSALLVMAPRARWPVFAAIVAGTGVAQYAVDGSLHSVVYIVINTATTGLYVYGLTKLGRLVAALHQARHEWAARAVADERIRFDEDVQVLLGTSLSAIAPHGEVALRLLPRDRDAVARELLDIQTIARRALADLRALAHLYRTSGEDGVHSVVGLLATSRVSTRVDLDLRALPLPVRSRVADVLRVVTRHVLRRPDIERCEIVLGTEGNSTAIEIHVSGPGADLDELAAALTARPADVVRSAGPVLRVAVPHTAHPHPADPPQADEVETMSPTTATRLVVAVICGSAAQAVLRLFWFPASAAALAATMVLLAGACALQLTLLTRAAATLRPPATYGLLAALGVLVFGQWLFVEAYWPGMYGLLAGSALLLLRPLPAWAAFVAVVATVAWSQVGSPSFPARSIGTVIVTVNVALIVYGLFWMLRSTRQLAATRRALAEAARADARTRFARDLHDLLGLSLSAIAMKSDLALRLLARDPDRAGTAVTELVDISRGALATVRTVAGGRHRTSLEEEGRDAERLLRATGVATRTDLDAEGIPPQIAAELALVLREGVTNVLRHSTGTRCEITVRASGDVATLRVVNDGVVDASDSDGTGLRNMAERVAALDGALTARRTGADGFELVASVPLDDHDQPADQQPAHT